MGVHNTRALDQATDSEVCTRYMDTDASRVRQVFIWKQGRAPDKAYARQVLSVVSPDVSRAVSGENPPLHLFAVEGSWPEDFWPRALQDMQSVPGAREARWLDPARYELSGWQGTDTRTGDRIFVVTVFARQGGPDAFQGEGVQTPPYVTQPLVQLPYSYYPQYATGPLGWPVQQVQGYPPYPGAPPGIYGQPAMLPSGYNPLNTGPLVHLSAQLPVLVGNPEQPEVMPVALPDSYAPFYAGFGERLVASLIDFFFLSFGEAFVVAFAIFFQARTGAQANDLGGWLSLYGPFACLGLLVFVAYHVVGWSAYGRTFGKRLMGIHVVRADGGVPGFGRSMLRMLGYFFSTSLLFSGFLLVVFDIRRQGLHDKMAETYVVPEKPSIPAPAGLPGYKVSLAQLPGSLPPDQYPAQARQGAPRAAGQVQGARGMAAVSPMQPYEKVSVNRTSEAHPVASTGNTEAGGAEQTGAAEAAQPSTPAMPTGNLQGRSRAKDGETIAPQVPAEPAASPANHAASTEPVITLGPATETLREQAIRDNPERRSDIERARSLYKRGLAELERGTRQSFGGMEVEKGAARKAVSLFREALDIVPTAVSYKYFYAVALRYAEGFDVAIGEFRQVLQLDPGHYEAQQQVALGPRWHDAFAYPAWGEPTLSGNEVTLPDPIRLLLPRPNRPGTRLVLLREGSNKMVVALSRTKRDTWTKLPSPDMPAHIQLVLTRTPQGPIIAFYVVIRDDPESPYKGETFLNPHDPGKSSDDACQLGQFMLAQLARQDHMYLIFVDENDDLLMSRKLEFDTGTQVNIARVHYEVQTLPPMVMDATRFGEAARWHMDNFSLDQIK